MIKIPTWKAIINYMKQSPANIYFVRNNSLSRLPFLLGTAALMFCISCVDQLTGDTGVEVLPASELIEQEFVDTLTLDLISTPIDTGVPSCNQFYQLFGNMYDPFMGEIQATSYIRAFFPDSLWDTNSPNNLIFDSLVLELDLFDFYGQFKTPQRLEIFEIVENWPECSMVDANSRLIVDSTLNVSGTFRDPQAGRILDFSQDTIIPGTLVLPLAPTLGEKLLFGTADDYASDSSFQLFFKGLSISSRALTPNNPLDPGGIYRTSLNNTASTFLRLHYQSRPNEDASFSPQVSRFRMSGLPTSRANNFSNITRRNVEGTPLDQESLNQNEFIQSGALVSLEGSIPGLKSLDILAINQAEIELKVDTSTFRATTDGDLIYEPPRGLEIVIRDSATKEVIIIPQIAGLGVTPTSYNADEGVYTFNISPFLQEAVDRKIEKIEFSIRPITQSTQFLDDFFNMSIDRVIFGGIENSAIEPKIFLTITRPGS